MIQKKQAFVTDDGLTHLTIEDARMHEAKVEFAKCPGITEPNTAATWLMQNAEKFIDILTSKANSKPRARKINGGTKVRKPKPTTTPAPQTA